MKGGNVKLGEKSGQFRASWATPLFQGDPVSQLKFREKTIKYGVTGSGLKIFYISLPPGDHTLHITARNSVSAMGQVIASLGRGGPL